MARANIGSNQNGYIGNLDTPNRQVPEHRFLPPFWRENVYFIQGHPDGFIKIGWAANPYLRLARIQMNSPMPVILIAFQDGGQKLEFSYHERFREHRRHGEWFAPAEEILALAAEIGLPQFPAAAPGCPSPVEQYGPWRPRSLSPHARGVGGRFVREPIEKNPVRFEPDRETFAQFRARSRALPLPGGCVAGGGG